MYNQLRFSYDKIRYTSWEIIEEDSNHELKIGNTGTQTDVLTFGNTEITVNIPLISTQTSFLNDQSMVCKKYVDDVCSNVTCNCNVFFTTKNMTEPEDPNGYGRGDRPNVILENLCFSSSSAELPILLNGRRGTGGGVNESNAHNYLRPGGALIFWHLTYSFNFNTVYMMTSSETGTYDNVFATYGSNNKINWIQLGSAAWNTWSNWNASSSDTGITHQSAGIFKKLTWVQDPTQYYRFYMFKVVSHGLTPGIQQRSDGRTIDNGMIYEIEWGRE